MNINWSTTTTTQYSIKSLDLHLIYNKIKIIFEKWKNNLWLFWFLFGQIKMPLILNQKQTLCWKHSIKSFNRISYSQLNIWTRKWTKLFHVESLHESIALWSHATNTHILSNGMVSLRYKKRPLNKVCNGMPCHSMQTKKEISLLSLFFFCIWC